jgi:hypothetical protein
MKKIFYIFALIGLIFTVFYIYSKINEHQILKLKHENCKKIKTGMPVKLARQILDDDLRTWGTNDLHGKIEYSFDVDSLPHYYIIYKPYKWAQSEFLYIYFDPQTLKVTKVKCGDQSIK